MFQPLTGWVFFFICQRVSVQPWMLPELWSPEESDETGSWKVDQCVLQVSSDAYALNRAPAKAEQRAETV